MRIIIQPFISSGIGLYGSLKLLILIWICAPGTNYGLDGPRQFEIQFPQHIYSRWALGVEPQTFWSWVKQHIHLATPFHYNTCKPPNPQATVCCYVGAAALVHFRPGRPGLPAWGFTAHGVPNKEISPDILLWDHSKNCWNQTCIWRTCSTSIITWHYKISSCKIQINRCIHKLCMLWSTVLNVGLPVGR